jgi:hypothetical protein
VILCAYCVEQVLKIETIYFSNAPFLSNYGRKLNLLCCIKGLDDDWQSIITWAELHWKSKSLKCCCLPYLHSKKCYSSSKGGSVARRFYCLEASPRANL